MKQTLLPFKQEVYKKDDSDETRPSNQRLGIHHLSTHDWANLYKLREKVIEHHPEVTFKDNAAWSAERIKWAAQYARALSKGIKTEAVSRALDKYENNEWLRQVIVDMHSLLQHINRCLSAEQPTRNTVQSDIDRNYVESYKKMTSNV